ncbi:MAG: ergothioneine biosynthesis protein EgtB [Ferruginibacter sp.]
MTHLDPTSTDDETLKEYVADELGRARQRSLHLTTELLDDQEMTRQHSVLMSPLVWDLAHVGNYEELWLLRESCGAPAIRPEIDGLYNAFEHPRAVRPSLPLLSPTESAGYIALVRRQVLDSLDAVRLDSTKPLLDNAFVYGMVVQHEHQHVETMLATHQLRRGPAVLPPAGDALPPRAVKPPHEVLVPAGEFVMGTSTDPWAYDNERPAYRVTLPAFWLDATPVSVGAFRRFTEEGCYDDRRWWSAKGWDWRCGSGARAPAFWFREGETWLRRRFGQVEALPDNEPVQHVCWFEADAYARWAGRRLPTEAEWEKAASWDPETGRSRRFPWGDRPATPDRANLGQRRYGPTPVGSFPEGASPVGALQMLGDVWEWTATDFTGHPGFCTFPYAEYSEVFFGSGYKVLRGGSWATDPLAARNTFRNWDFPVRRQIFAGFRTARDA